MITSKFRTSVEELGDTAPISPNKDVRPRRADLIRPVTLKVCCCGSRHCCCDCSKIDYKHRRRFGTVRGLFATRSACPRAKRGRIPGRRSRRVPSSRKREGVLVGPAIVARLKSQSVTATFHARVVSPAKVFASTVRGDAERLENGTGECTT